MVPIVSIVHFLFRQKIPLLVAWPVPLYKEYGTAASVYTFNFSKGGREGPNPPQGSMVPTETVAFRRQHSGLNAYSREMLGWPLRLCR